MKKILLLAATVIAIAGCKNNFTEGDSGTLYSIVEHKGNNPLIKQGDIVFMHVIIKDEADSVLSNTYDALPSTFTVPKPLYKGDMMSTITMLSEGDSAVVKLNADTVLRRAGDLKPPGFKGRYYVNTIKILKVFSKQKEEDYDSFQNKINSYLNSLKEKAKAEEPIKIKNYIANSKLTLTTTASGLKYAITNPGNGAKASSGDSVLVNYTGKLLNGKVFDTSLSDVAKKAKKFQEGRAYVPIRIMVGINQVIKGWDEGLQLLSKGAKATFVIPSNLAYGEQGVPQLGVGPFQPLAFDIEVIDITHPKSTR